MPLIFYTMRSLVQEFLPHMLEQGDGAILTAPGGRHCAGPAEHERPPPCTGRTAQLPASPERRVVGKGVYVGMLYIGAAIKDSAFHTEMEKANSGNQRSYGFLAIPQ